MKYIMVVLYLIFTVLGLVLYKKGANNGISIVLNNGYFNLNISLISILGLCFYLLSFIIYMVILPKFDLTFIYPILTCITFISVYLLSITILNEKFTIQGLIGIIFMVIGIFLINFKR